MRGFHCFTYSGILISLFQQNFKIRKCCRVANSVCAHAWCMFLSFALFTLLTSIRGAKFLPIFQTNGQKIHLNWFSSTVHKIFEKKTLQNIYMLFSQVFSSRSFTWALLYLQAVGWQNTDRNWICSSQGQFVDTLFIVRRVHTLIQH